MAALRKPIPAQETEVIYLLVPPHAPPRKRAPNWSPVERAALALLQFRLRAYDSVPGRAVRAVGLVAGYTLMALPIMFGAYCAKSALGIDLMPGRSIVKEIAPDLHYDGPALSAR